MSTHLLPAFPREPRVPSPHVRKSGFGMPNLFDRSVPDTFHGAYGALMENVPLRYRRSTREWCMSLSTFCQLDAGAQRELREAA